MNFVDIKLFKLTKSISLTISRFARPTKSSDAHRKFSAYSKLHNRIETSTARTPMANTHNQMENSGK